MAKEITPGPVCGGGTGISEAVCIHTDKVYDSCRDKECIEDVRVYLTNTDQELVDRALSVKCGGAKILWVYTDVEPVPFNNGYFTVDIRFFFKVTLDVYCSITNPTRVEGLAIYDKKVVLFGSEGKSKVFQSVYKYDAMDRQLAGKSNMPKAVVEAVDPICLSARIVDPCPQRPSHDGCDLTTLPEFICSCFNDVFADPDADRRVYVTLGLFSITKLERNVQLLIPVYDFCIPENDCVSATQDNPCELFDRIEFPVDEFYPPQKHQFNFGNNLGNLSDSNSNGCGCGCN